MDKQQKPLTLNSIFRYDYLESKTFYMYCYQQPPCLTWVNQVNTDRVLA